MPNALEAMIASPPERDELVVQIFVRDGGQWAEVYRDENGRYQIDIYPLADSLTVPLDHIVEVLQHSVDELKGRLEDE